MESIVLVLNDNSILSSVRNNIFTNIVAFSINSTLVKYHQADQNTDYSEVNSEKYIFSYI